MCRNGFTLYCKPKSRHFWDYITPQEGIFGFFVNARLIYFVVVFVVVVFVVFYDDDVIIVIIFPQVIWKI